jgi:enoyl-CoA hydratase/carnithine racemase
VTFEVFAELGNLVDRMEADEDLKVVVFDSADPEFYLAHFDMVPPKEPYTGPAWLDTAARMTRSPVISIASIRGRARGGWAASSLWPVTCVSPPRRRPYWGSRRWLRV